jgi:hypothetical protein
MVNIWKKKNYGSVFTDSEGDNQDKPRLVLRSSPHQSGTPHAQPRMFHDRIGIDDVVVRPSSVDQRLERTNLRSIRTRRNCKLLEELTNVLSIFTASLELRSIVRGRELVFVSSTTKGVRPCKEKLDFLVREIREWAVESIPWVGSVEVPTSQMSYGTFE